MTTTPMKDAFGYYNLAEALEMKESGTTKEIDFCLHVEILKHRFGWSTDIAVSAVLEMRKQNYHGSENKFSIGDFSSPGSLFLWNVTEQGDAFWYELDTKFESTLSKIATRLQDVVDGRLSLHLAYRAIEYAMLHQHYSMLELLDENDPSLMYMFAWSDTTEGFDFWSNIHYGE